MDQRTDHRAADHLDCQVRCGTCGDALRVSWAECCAYGWPLCCGLTMALVSPVDPLILGPSRPPRAA